jgi:hypothetical protein
MMDLACANITKQAAKARLLKQQFGDEFLSSELLMSWIQILLSAHMLQYLFGIIVA